MAEALRILIVDDEPSFIEIAKLKLEAEGFSVSAASNQAEALRLAAALQPVLILMDIHMPGKTGTDTALSLKQDPRTKNLRIVFLSSLKEPWAGFGGSERETMARELGMEHFLDKAEVIENLGAVVRKIISES